jgi:glycosyltransferase involved in cell wall biosynthesis
MIPEISIVLATFDRPRSLARCLDALQLQHSTRSFEILVVDNHPQSTLTASLKPRYREIVWLQEPIPGLSRARNLGIAAASGSTLVTTDDDVIPPPGWLERLTAPLFHGDPNLAATTGNCLPLKVDTPAEALFEAYGGLRHGDLPATFDAAWMAQWRVCFPQLWRIGTTANAAFRTDVLRSPAVCSNAGPFDTGLGAGSPAGAWEDLYCFYRILNAGFTIAYLPEAQLLHAHRETVPELTRQLCGYRRGETAFLTTMLLRHRDLRALGQLFFWIPHWRISLLLGEIHRRLTGHRRYSLRLFWQEAFAYLAGPTCYSREKTEAVPLHRKDPFQDTAR